MCFQFSQCGTGNTGEVGGICDWARRAPHRGLSLRGGRVAWVARWGHQCACTTGTLSRAVTDRRPHRAGRALQTLQAFELLVSGTELLVTHTASCRLTWHGTDSSARAILLSEGLSKASVQCWRRCTQQKCCAEPNQIPERCPWYLLDSSYQYQAHNYILQHKIHYCSWINCSSGCRMPLCTVQPSLCLQIQGQSRCIC